MSYNLFAYCLNNPVNRFDVDGNRSFPNWAKVNIGAKATVDAGAVAVAVNESGKNLPSLQSIPREEITERIIGGNGYLDNKTMAKNIT